GLVHDGGTFVFEALDAGSFAASHRLRVRDDDGGVVWEAGGLTPDGGSRVETFIDPRVLNEFAGTLNVEADYGTSTDFGAEPAITQQEAVRLVADPLRFDATQVPPSRGATCDELRSPCVLTDGRLEPWEPDLRFSLPPPVITLRFEAPVTPRLVVLRDVAVNANDYVLSDDGRTTVSAWGTVTIVGLTAAGGEVELGAHKLFANLNTRSDDPPRPRGQWVAIPVDSPEPLSGVQLRTQTFWRLAEVSVF
ncbi:MAG: hypothetical protein ACO1OB_03540, partial [Archangium sp.]